MRIVLPDTFTEAALDAAIDVLQRSRIAVRTSAFLTSDDRAAGSIVFVAHGDGTKALSALELANITVSI